MAESLGGDALLISLEDVRDFGQVLDTKEQKLYPPMPMQSFLIRGFWRSYTGHQDVEELLQGVERVESLTPEVEER